MAILAAICIAIQNHCLIRASECESFRRASQFGRDLRTHASTSVSFSSPPFLSSHRQASFSQFQGYPSIRRRLVRRGEELGEWWSCFCSLWQTRADLVLFAFFADWCSHFVSLGLISQDPRTRRCHLGNDSPIHRYRHSWSHQ